MKSSFNSPHLAPASALGKTLLYENLWLAATQSSICVIPELVRNAESQAHSELPSLNVQLNKVPQEIGLYIKV